MDFGGGANRLTDLQRDQFSNDEVAEDERDREGADRGRDGAKRRVSEDVETADCVAELVEVIQHQFTPAGVRFSNSSRTASIRAVRLPFTRTRSPGDVISFSRSAASAALVTFVACSNPAAFAACEIIAPSLPIVMRCATCAAAAASPTSLWPRSDSVPSSP